MTPSSTTTDVSATNTYNTMAEIRHSILPRLDDFLSISSFSLPLSFADLSLRFNNNIYTFRGNYAIISLLVFIVTLVFRPIIAIVFLIIIVAWIYLFFARHEPLVFFDFEIGDRSFFISLSLITIVAVAVARVWWNLFIWIVIALLLVLLVLYFPQIDLLFEKSTSLKIEGVQTYVGKY